MITLKMKKKWIGILEIIILVFLDQITKYWAVVNLKNGNPIEVITGVFSLQYLENFGAAFGVLQNATAFFIILTIILLMGFIFVSMKLPDDGRYKPIRYLLIFFIAGAIDFIFLNPVTNCGIAKDKDIVIEVNFSHALKLSLSITLNAPLILAKPEIKDVTDLIP